MLALATLVGLLASAPSVLEIGKAAPDFMITPIQGETFRFAEALQGHAATVVVFLSVVCPYSNYNDTHLSDLARELGPRGALLVGVNSNRTETAQEVAEHARSKGQTFPIMKDTGNHVADALGASVTPEAFVFDHDGHLRYRGRIRSKQGASDLKDAIEAVLAGRAVKTPVAKAFGCAITRE